MDLIITILPVVTKDLPISPRFTPYNFLSRCKFSTLTTRQPMVEFYLLTFPRFPLRKKEHKSYVGKNRTHDFRTSRCAAYLLDHSGAYSFVVFLTIPRYFFKKNLNAPRPSEHPPVRGGMSKRFCCIVRTLKKNQTTPRPSEHPPVMGKKMSKRSGGIKRLQIQNHFMAFKQVPRCR